MKKFFSRKELIKKAINMIRYFENQFDNSHDNYYRDKASDVVSNLYLFEIIDNDKYDLLFRIYKKMFFRE